MFCSVPNVSAEEQGAEPQLFCCPNDEHVIVDDEETLLAVCIMCGYTPLPQQQPPPLPLPPPPLDKPEPLWLDSPDPSLSCSFQNKDDLNEALNEGQPTPDEAEALAPLLLVEPYDPEFRCHRDVKGLANALEEERSTKAFIREMCAKLYLSGDQLVAQFVQDYLVMKQQWCQWLVFLEDHAHYFNVNVRQLYHYHRHPKDLATLSVYKSFQRTGTSRSLKELAFVCGANTKRLWKMQRRWDERQLLLEKGSSQQQQHDEPSSSVIMTLTPQDLLQSRLGYLQLPVLTLWQHLKTLNAALRQTKAYRADFASHTIVATCVYHYTRSDLFRQLLLPKQPLPPDQKTRKTKKAAPSFKVTKSTVSEIFFTTTMSVLRYEKYLKKHNVTFFPPTQ